MSNAYAAVETDLWDAELAADNVWNIATSAAISTFRAADFSAQSLAASNLPAAVGPSASTAWSDWSHFQSKPGHDERKLVEQPAGQLPHVAHRHQ